MLKPALRDIRVRHKWERRLLRETQRVTLRARFPPQQLFGFCDLEIHPLLLTKNAKGHRKGLLRQIALGDGRRHSKLGRVRRNVALKFLHQESMNNFWRVVRHAFLKVWIELQAVARDTMFGVRDGSHVRTAIVHRRWQRFFSNGWLMRRERRATSFWTSRRPVFERRIRDRGSMAILTIQIHQTRRSAKIVLQMHRGIELDGPGIAASQPQRGEFRMFAVKARHALRKMRSGAGGVQVGMTLRATDIRSCGQQRIPAMLFVTIRAIRREELIGMMDRPVVARFAALVAGLGAE